LSTSGWQGEIKVKQTAQDVGPLVPFNRGVQSLKKLHKIKRLFMWNKAACQLFGGEGGLDKPRLYLPLLLLLLSSLSLPPSH
jgi:hypothetical protein